MGRLEGKIDILTHNQDGIIASVDMLKKTINRQIWYNSGKIIGGSFLGGCFIMLAKLMF